VAYCFAQSHDVAIVIDERKQFAIAPHAALTQGAFDMRLSRHVFLRPSAQRREVVTGFEQPIALRAIVEDGGDVVTLPARGLNRQDVIHGEP